MSNPTSFHQFSRLPQEIRLMIWEFTWPGPRTIHVSRQLCPRCLFDGDILLGDVNTWKEWTGVDPDDCGGCSHYLYASTPHVNFHDLPFTLVRLHRPENPLALSVCREARNVSRQRFRLAFGTPDLFFDFEADSIFLDDPPLRYIIGYDGARNDDLIKWKEGPEIRLPESLVYKDLMKVQNIVVSAEMGISISREPESPQDLTKVYRGGVVLREYLRYFKSLKVCTVMGEPLFSCTIWEPRVPCLDTIPLKLDELNSIGNSLTLKKAIQKMLVEFATEELLEEEEAYGVPLIQPVKYWLDETEA
ncbi:uncharacterized protein BP5553_02714 [Venustampulla echinocandica]|uniref:2EXR domain-containing protein n=1 Tax=Venustampulla echinocandica TaxID=2656787 RepID=A0A370TS92_9HELO|nr:uncharacterized protein BP5553_02714 [Venustampulla echinocandica]RDL38374.1 hypothetical protein BP5553_02714 [Venustampulla echinocandica]